MVHNSTNINTTSNHFSFQTNEHKNTTTFGVGNSGPCLGLRKHVAGLHPLMGSTPPPPLIIRTPTKTHTHTHTHIYKQTIINLYRFAPMQKHHTLSEKRMTASSWTVQLQSQRMLVVTRLLVKKI